MLTSVRITRREWLRVAALTLILMVLTSVPYLLAWSSAGENWRFGGFLLGVEDGNAYLGKMRLGMRGETSFYLFYTPERHDAAPLINLAYILPGWLVGRFMPESDPRSGDALILAFHAMRIVFSVLLMALMYTFIARFIRSKRARLFALTIATFGGGFGWLFGLTGQLDWLGTLPPDLYIPEGFSFLVFFGLPHVILARAALLAGLILIIDHVQPYPLTSSSREDTRLSERNIDDEPHPLTPSPLRGEGELGGTYHPLSMSMERGKRGEAVAHSTSPLGQNVTNAANGGKAVASRLMAAAACWWIAGLCVPFYLAVLYAILGAWGVAAWVVGRRFPWMLFWSCITAAGLSLPLFIYNAAAFALNPAFAVWSAQNQLASPHPLHYLIAYALIGGLALLGGTAAWRKAGLSMRYTLLIGWVAIVPLLVYLPINVQRRTSEAVIVPLAILASYGVIRLARSIRRLPLKTARTGMMLFAALSALFVLFGSTLTAITPRTPQFRPAAERAMFAWLNERLTPQDVILAAPTTGNALPAYVRARTFMGHGPETLLWQAKTDWVERFYRGELTEAEHAVLFNPPCPPPRDLTPADLCLLPVTVVLYTPAERALAPGDIPVSWKAALELVYDAAGYQVYMNRNIEPLL